MSVMAVLRGLRRRLRQMNPCNTCLVVVFLAVVFYLISAIRGNYFRPSGTLSAEGRRDSMGPGDRRRLSALGGNDGGPAGQRRRLKERAGSFVVGDDEIQLCKMTSRWASSVVDEQDYLHFSSESAASAAARERHDWLNSCSAAYAADPVPTLFYVDAGGALTYNHTAAAGSKYEMVGSCTAKKIEWSSDMGYVEKNVSLLTKIDADFIHISCRVRRNINDGGNVNDEGRTVSYRTPRPRPLKRSDRHRTTTSLLIADIAERRARQMHRDQLRRHSPNFFGTVGLPDPLSNVIAQQGTSSQDAGESEKQATQNELRPRRDEQPPVDQRKSVEKTEPVKGRQPDVQSLFRFERALSQSDERDDVNNASTEVYDQWIAHIHPLSEVVDRDEAHDDKRLDVLVLALESVSSISFDRDLHQSHRFLVDQPHTVLFTGYNVIGDAAPANIIPMLTGTLFHAVYPTMVVFDMSLIVFPAVAQSLTDFDFIIPKFLTYSHYSCYSTKNH